jgi:hypothetical protein
MLTCCMPLQIEQSFKMQVNTGLQQDGESDEFKRVLLEGNPYLLALTFTVSLLHRCELLCPSSGLSNHPGTLSKQPADVSHMPCITTPCFTASSMADPVLPAFPRSFFDFLAFKNDIGFWKDNKSMEGLSARSITLNAFCQLVIFLYLLDNETSFVVIISSGVGTAIEFWKVTKAMDVSSAAPPFPLCAVFCCCACVVVLSMLCKCNCWCATG